MEESRSSHHRTDPLTGLLYLEQTGNVQEFYNSFNLLQIGVTISEDLVLEVFLRGLKPEIEKYVRLFNPRILKDAYFWARLKEFTIPVSGVKEDVVVDEFGEENGLEYAKKGYENVDVFEVFDEMPEKIIGMDDWTRSSYKSFDDEKDGIRVANSVSEISDVFGEWIKEEVELGAHESKIMYRNFYKYGMTAATSENNREEEASWTKHNANSPRIEGYKDGLKGKKEEGTQLARKMPTYSKIQKSNLRLGFANLEDKVLRRGEYCYELRMYM